MYEDVILNTRYILFVSIEASRRSANLYSYAMHKLFITKSFAVFSFTPSRCLENLAPFN